MGPRKKQLKVSEPSLVTKTDDKPTKSSKATTSSTKTKKFLKILLSLFRFKTIFKTNYLVKFIFKQ